MTTITAANAADEIERRLNELCACCALFPDAKADPRAWMQLMIYLPAEAIEGHVARRLLELERRVNESRAKIELMMTWWGSLDDTARAILAQKVREHDL